jgi:hypothetical protein
VWETARVGYRLRWLAVVCGIGLAAVGGGVAYLLASGPWAAAGAVIGAVAGFVAPYVQDEISGRADLRERMQEATEKALPGSWARLLDPRLGLIDFVGRVDELAALTAWCEHDEGRRLRLVTGPGGVGKTRLALELAARMEKRGWTVIRVADGSEATVVGLGGVSCRTPVRRRMRSQGRATLSQSFDDPIQVLDDYSAYRHGFPPCSQVRDRRLFRAHVAASRLRGDGGGTRPRCLPGDRRQYGGKAAGSAATGGYGVKWPLLMAPMCAEYGMDTL